MFATTEKKEKKRKETAHSRVVNKPNANQGVILALYTKVYLQLAVPTTLV